MRQKLQRHSSRAAKEARVLRVSKCLLGARLRCLVVMETSHCLLFFLCYDGFDGEMGLMVRWV